jgi:Spy/CpxP family protein refolding chaperone
MLRKITLALVAAASLGAMALAPSAASAKPWGGGWGGGFHHHHFGPGFGIAYVDGCYVTRRIRTPFGYRLRTVNVCY